jgi:adenine/guanine phosphoribosyltransferase-like PRPP-binding protein
MEPHEFWQALSAPGDEAAAPPFADAYPAVLPDGRVLHLPIRARPDGSGLASLIVNQASFAVQDALIGLLAEQLRRFEVDVVVGLPTLGLTVASGVAAALGHPRYVPCGTSRKFWYDEALSAPLASVTTPDVRRLYLDPRLLPLLAGRRVALIDDVLSTGRSIAAGLELMRLAGVEPVAIGALMLQTTRWRAALPVDAPAVLGVFASPALRKSAEGWMPD